jgi:hypothetical protein
MSTSRSTATRTITVGDSVKRCRHTLLTKPECHCRACLLEQMATYGGRPDLAGFARAESVDRAAA